VSTTALLSASGPLLSYLFWSPTQFCSDVAYYDQFRRITLTVLTIGTGLTLFVPVIFGVWGFRAVGNRQIGRRLAICASGYLLPVLAWTFVAWYPACPTRDSRALGPVTELTGPAT
jgi:hypothetical protein